MAALLTVLSLSACMVVPIDPRTGQPYPTQPAAQVNVFTPPAAPAAPASTVLSARLYPMNPQASHAGMLTATVLDQQSGRASFSVNYLGDTLQGEATRIERTKAGLRGIANGYGPRGISTQCEYTLTAPGRGTGSCTFSDGAVYQMHFGG